MHLKQQGTLVVNLMSDKNNEKIVADVELEENHAQKDPYSEIELPGEKLATRRRELNLTGLLLM